MGNSGIKAKDKEKYERWLNSGKSGEVVKKTFKKNYPKLKNSDSIWDQFYEEYCKNHPKGVGGQNSRGDGERRSESREDSADQDTEKRLAFIHEMKKKTSHRRKIVEMHMQELTTLKTGEKWTIRLRVNGEREKQFKKGSPRANTIAYWNWKLNPPAINGNTNEDDVDSLGEGLPPPGLFEGLDEDDEIVDSETPAISNIDALDHQRNLSQGQLPQAYYQQRASNFSDNASVVSGMSSVSMGSQTVLVQDASGRVSYRQIPTLTSGTGSVASMNSYNSGVSYVSQGSYHSQPPLIATNSAPQLIAANSVHSVHSSPYVTQPTYVTQQQYVTQAGYVAAPNQYVTPPQYVTQQGQFGAPPPNQGTPRKSSISSSDAGKGHKSKRQRPRTRTNRAKKKS